jgi:hypothetical protein
VVRHDRILEQVGADIHHPAVTLLPQTGGAAWVVFSAPFTLLSGWTANSSPFTMRDDVRRPGLSGDFRPARRDRASGPAKTQRGRQRICG